MTILQFVITYITCWWLVLFMVLPHQADAPQTPGLGHAPSAPENPHIRKKLKWTTLFAVIPAALLYFIVGAAQAAEDSIYHAASGGCKSRGIYHAPKDIMATETEGTADKPVKPATLGGGSKLVDTDNIEIPIKIPSENYINKDKYNADMSESFIDAGKLKISRDGATTLNDKPVAPDTEDCQ